jgi:DNA polymerase-4
LPVGLIWGVGPVTEQRLAERGIRTVGELARTPTFSLEHLLGQAVGAKLGALAQDRDPRRIVTSSRARSVGAQSALGRRTADEQLVREVLTHLADRVATRLRAKHRAGRTVTVRVRFAGMRSVTRSVTRTTPVAATLTLTELAEQLAWQAIRDQPGATPEVSLLAISVSNLVVLHAIQLELPLKPEDAQRPGSAQGAARWAADRSVDAIREKFGRGAVGYLPVELSRSGGVPDEFRELAEHEL